MKILKRPRWAIGESRVTPEAVFRSRRNLLAAGAGIAGAAAFGLAGPFGGGAGPAEAAAPGTPFVPMPPRNPAYATAGRDITPEAVNTTYNNFYEFGSHKSISAAAEALVTEPWKITIDGLVEKTIEIDAADLIARMPVEERVYRHRCVEAWSMVVPWIGFPLPALLGFAQPLSGARYVRFETFLDPQVARGQRQHWYPWPYVEGVSMEEAASPLALMVVGAYGKVLHKSFGAPIRLHLPWKYGFKSIKSIQRISFVADRPVSFWEELQASEYGFWANVNPEVSHPRWSQASERVLGTEERIPTEMFNGYGPEVAHLYAGKEAAFGDRLWR